MQNLVKIGSRGGGRGVWANTLILAVHLGLPFFIFYFLHPSLSVSVAPRPTATNEGSKRVFPAKQVPFGGLNNEKLHLGIKTPKAMGHGSVGQMGHFFGWVTSVMGQCMLTHDPPLF